MPTLGTTALPGLSRSAACHRGRWRRASQGLDVSHARTLSIVRTPAFRGAAFLGKFDHRRTSPGSSTIGEERPFGQVRLLGPIEYACAWYAQQSNLTALSQRQFDAVLTALLSLIANDAEAAELYRRKLLHDADDPLGGALSNRTRDGLRHLVSAWAEQGPSAAAEAFHAQLAESSLLSQVARSSHHF